IRLQENEKKNNERQLLLQKEEQKEIELKVKESVSIEEQKYIKQFGQEQKEGDFELKNIELNKIEIQEQQQQQDLIKSPSSKQNIHSQSHNLALIGSERAEQLLWSLAALVKKSLSILTIFYPQILLSEQVIDQSDVIDEEINIKRRIQKEKEQQALKEKLKFVRSFVFASLFVALNNFRTHTQQSIEIKHRKVKVELKKLIKQQKKKIDDKNKDIESEDESESDSLSVESSSDEYNEVKKKMKEDKQEQEAELQKKLQRYLNGEDIDKKEEETTDNLEQQEQEQGSDQDQQKEDEQGQNNEQNQEQKQNKQQDDEQAPIPQVAQIPTPQPEPEHIEQFVIEEPSKLLTKEEVYQPINEFTPKTNLSLLLSQATTQQNKQGDQSDIQEDNQNINSKQAKETNKDNELTYVDKDESYVAAKMNENPILSLAGTQSIFGVKMLLEATPSEIQQQEEIEEGKKVNTEKVEKKEDKLNIKDIEKANLAARKERLQQLSQSLFASTFTLIFSDINDTIQKDQSIVSQNTSSTTDINQFRSGSTVLLTENSVSTLVIFLNTLTLSSLSWLRICAENIPLPTEISSFFMDDQSINEKLVPEDIREYLKKIVSALQLKLSKPKPKEVK
ncbi:MAG: hypothetical protein EZS28_040471, partial [Streblomastix strix]